MVCSPQEIAALRAELGRASSGGTGHPRAGTASGDQRRTGTPAEGGPRRRIDPGGGQATAGRPPNPAAAADAIVREIGRGDARFVYRSLRRRRGCMPCARHAESEPAGEAIHVKRETGRRILRVVCF